MRDSPSLIKVLLFVELVVRTKKQDPQSQLIFTFGQPHTNVQLSLGNCLFSVPEISIVITIVGGGVPLS